MAQCLLLHGWLVLLKTGACRGLPIFFEVTTNWRAGCQKFACPVRREGRPESSSLPLSSPRHRLIRSSNEGHLRRNAPDRTGMVSGRIWGAAKHCLAFTLFLAFLTLTPWPLILSASPS